MKTKTVLTPEQRKLVEDNYYLVKEVMTEMKLSENAVEDWHGFLSEILCLYIAKKYSEKIHTDEIKIVMKSAILDHMQRQISVKAKPVGLLRRLFR